MMLTIIWGDIYDYFFNLFGRDSYDDAGATMIATVHYGVGYQNAFWNGIQMVFGDGFTVDDVTAHEMIHGITQHEANLIYRDESGALNESFSDIFGEFIDQLNVNIPPDPPGDDWLMGEDIPGIGAIRDMSDPPAFGDPDKVSDYECTRNDNGGVHTNSGIANKAAYLMVEGGTFNGQTVDPIGLLKTAHVHYLALTEYLGASSGFVDYYHNMNLVCSVLVGGPEGITADDCIQVNNALRAVEMDTAPSCRGGWSLVYPTLVDTPSDLKLLRRYRDEVMANSVRGRLYTRLLYTNSEAALKVLQDNPTLMTHAAQLIAVNKSAIEDVLNGGEGVLQNTDEIVTFLGAYARQSPAGLKFFVNMVKSGIIRHKLMGRPFLGFKLE